MQFKSEWKPIWICHGDKGNMLSKHLFHPKFYRYAFLQRPQVGLYQFSYWNILFGSAEVRISSSPVQSCYEMPKHERLNGWLAAAGSRCWKGMYLPIGIPYTRRHRLQSCSSPFLHNMICILGTNSLFSQCNTRVSTVLLLPIFYFHQIHTDVNLERSDHNIHISGNIDQVPLNGFFFPLMSHDKIWIK